MKSLNNLKAAHKTYLKTALLLIVSLLGGIYVFFSYYQTLSPMRPEDILPDGEDFVEIQNQK